MDSQNYTGSNFYSYAQNYTRNPAEQEDPNAHLYKTHSRYHQQWSYGGAGYSNASSPGTSGSSANSMNAQCSSSPSPDISMDSLINTLMQVVGDDHLGMPSTSSAQPPQAGSFINVRCNNCSNIACNGCFPSLFPYPSDPIEFEPTIPRDIMEALNPAIINPSLSTSGVPFYCEYHRDNRKLYYCQTCCKPFCLDCGFQFHQDHVVVSLYQAINDANFKATQVLRDTRLGIGFLKEELDAVQLAAEMLDQKARQASADLMLCMRKLAAALEAREKELLNRIEKARVQKFAALKERDEGLRNGIIRLSRAADKLTAAINERVILNNPLKLLITKDLVAAEIFQICENHLALPSPEENWISFNGMESGLLNAIGSLGSVAVTNPGPIGDRRTPQNEETPPQIPPIRRTPFPSVTAPPGGKPVADVDHPVRVRMPSGSEKSIRAERVIGNEGEVAEVLCRPWGVACDRDGNMVVADRSNNRIQIYMQDGTLIRRFGTYGTAPGHFDRPAGVAVDARRRIIVADKDNHRIQVLTMDGNFLLCFGEKGARCGQFNYPWDVATNSECQIVVSDTRNHRVQLFSAEGVFLRKYGYEATPSMWKHFDSPRGIAFNPAGKVITTDFNNHKILVIDADFMNARVLDCKTPPSTTTKQFLRPQGLVVDDSGNIIVADSRNHRIQVFDPTGVLLWRFGSYGKCDNEMDRPSGIALCPDGKLAIIDFGNNRLLLI